MGKHLRFNMAFISGLMLGLAIICYSGLVLANTTHFTSPILHDANKLVDIDPVQAQSIVTDYLENRQLINHSGEYKPSTPRDDGDQRIRTPINTINALIISAKAQFNIGATRNALQTLDEATALAKTHHLMFLELEVGILETRMLWTSKGDATKALDALTLIENNLKVLDKGQGLSLHTYYKINLLRAEIASSQKQYDLANTLFIEAGKSIAHADTIWQIDFHTQFGKHFLSYNKYNEALSELLVAYWRSIEQNDSGRLAKVNVLLAQLFQQRNVLDKALEHLTQSADFYDNYPNSPLLVSTVKKLGELYYAQGKPNLALVHYFNVIDHPETVNDVEKVIDIRLSLAATYLRLYNYTLAEQYVERAQTLLAFADYPELKARAALLYAGLAYHKQEADKVIAHATEALKLAQQVNSSILAEYAHQLLALGYEQKGNFQLALIHTKQANSLQIDRQTQFNLISQDDFRQQKQFVEQSLHYGAQTQQLAEVSNDQKRFRKIAFALVCILTLASLIIIRLMHSNRKSKFQRNELTNNLFTHPRSGLSNLRLLNLNLPSSLEKTQHYFEQWQVGELISEPLSDKLRFVMMDLPFLSNAYLQNGYKAGLALENAFGAFIANKVVAPARLYHFSDAHLLYIEPSTQARSAEDMYHQLQGWINEFATQHDINAVIRLGMADYPFLPRAYTAINDQELLDILLLATHKARDVSKQSNTSQWVYLKAIDSAPAASLATDDIRLACQAAINQGLIKINSSFDNE